MDTALGRDRLREFIDLLVGSLGEEIDGKAIASRGCLSRYQFDHLVSAALHESPGAFRRRLLLERAAWRLGTSRDSITREALRSGYRSAEGFTRAFTRAFGRTPARYRQAPNGFHIAAPNGVHYHPPGGLTVPGPTTRSTGMDAVDRLVGHDLWLTERMLNRAEEFPDESLDRTVLKDQARLYGVTKLTLRSILDALVLNKEKWTASVTGKALPPEERCRSIQGLKERLAASGPEFHRIVKETRERGKWDAGFVDALCDPPESFTYGGMLAHIVTFSAYRRTLALLAFRELGIDDLGIGDPVEWERSLA